LKTRVTMEEQYSTLSAVYESLETKEKILESANRAIKKFGITPDIMVKPHSQVDPGKGRVIIEFGFNDRFAGEFFEYLIEDNCLSCE